MNQIFPNEGKILRVIQNHLQHIIKSSSSDEATEDNSTSLVNKYNRQDNDRHSLDTNFETWLWWFK